jgi:hypothetical protein
MPERTVTPALIITGGVDPDYPDNALPGVPGLPDNTLPDVERPVDPGYGIPLPPVTIWPKPPHPSHHPLPPTYPVDPDYDLPLRPGIWPSPPTPVDPDYGVPVPIRPNHDLPIYGHAPNNDLPLPPGAVWPPLPPSVTGEILAFVWIVGVGYRWVCIDLDLEPTHPIVPPSTVPMPPMAPGGQPEHPITGQPRPDPKK